MDSMDSLNQSAIREAVKQDIYPIPDWLEVGKYAFSTEHQRNVKVNGFLGHIANCLVSGETVHIEIEKLSPSTIEVTEFDISKISHLTYASVATEWQNEIKDIQIFPGDSAKSSTIPAEIHPSLKQALIQTGINEFYSHQLKAWNELNQGHSICITTPTASGKSNSFIPFSFHQALTKQRTSLFIYPLKALASDQYSKLIKLNQALPSQEQLFIAKCTGDVPLETRKNYFKGVKCPDIIVISPDVLHHLLYHTDKSQLVLLKDFLSRLNLIVCDESHTYISSFGIHFANLLRRLRLAAQNSGNSALRLRLGLVEEINWVISTATISNPLELASQLTGLSSNQITLINESGAKSHEKTLLVFNPQNSPNFASTNLISSLLNFDLKGLVFVNSRQTAKHIFSLLSYHHGGYISSVDLFYGSLRSEQRKERIEQLSNCETKILITTNCLEAGIDLPELDFVVLRGFSSLNSFWQRGGRCGRKSPGLIIFIPDSNNHIDYYYATQPQRLLSPVEKVKIQPNYPSILSRHLLCAAAEGGLNSDEVTQYFGDKSDLVTAELLKQKQLSWSLGKRLWKRGYPHKYVSLRGIQDETISLIDVKTSKILEEMSLYIAHKECHTGAIYLTASEGKTNVWRCKELDLKQNKAFLELENSSDKRTKPDVQLAIEPLSKLEDPSIVKTAIPNGNLRLIFYWGKVKRQVMGFKELQLVYAPTCINRNCSHYQIPKASQMTKCPGCGWTLKQRLNTQEIAKFEFKPPLETTIEVPLLRIEVNETLATAITNKAQEIKKAILKTYHNPDDIPHQLSPTFSYEPVHLALHSLCHLLTKTVPLLFLASHQDLSSYTEQRPANIGTSHRTIAYIFDSVHEGCGTTEALVNDWDNCVEKALELATNCDCGDMGCPRCLTEIGCPESNDGLSKLLGIWLLEQIANSP
ncbi:Helicase, C-terminal [Crocosphaera watsonii WH 0401]|uniref:Helicase, C-terminal n=2 Tax=Crocosphaera watsonii TaxID=263511 RepID=T2JGL9_CROWT|nr:Helicase, C-terminal [Crocosphaera watsonii WH 0401]